jgi:hypothetical protein
MSMWPEDHRRQYDQEDSLHLPPYQHITTTVVRKLKVLKVLLVKRNAIACQTIE